MMLSFIMIMYIIVRIKYFFISTYKMHFKKGPPKPLYWRVVHNNRSLNNKKNYFTKNQLI